MADGVPNTSSNESTRLLPKTPANSKFKGRTSVYGNGGDVNIHDRTSLPPNVGLTFNGTNNDGAWFNAAGRDLNIETCKPAHKKLLVILGLIVVVVIVTPTVILTTRKPTETGECASIKQIPNRDVYCTNKNVVGSVCTFSCIKGNLTKGPAKVTCLASKQWSDKLPVCECPPCTAGPECRTIDWNKLVTYTDLSEKIYYGSHEIECISNGRWRWRGFKSEWVYDGTCTDINTRETQLCKDLESGDGAKQHALANLIKKGKGYPTPCGKENWLGNLSCDQ